MYELIVNACKNYGIHLASYEKSQKVIKALDLTENTIDNPGFCTIIDGNYIVFYDDKLPTVQKGITLAHEFAHVVFGHPLCPEMHNKKIGEIPFSEFIAEIFACVVAAGTLLNGKC